MGMGGPKDSESHEVTVELEGEVSPEAFEAYMAKLRECIAALAQIVDTKKGGNKLKVRLIGTRVRRRR